MSTNDVHPLKVSCILINVLGKEGIVFNDVQSWKVQSKNITPSPKDGVSINEEHPLNVLVNIVALLGIVGAFFSDVQ